MKHDLPKLHGRDLCCCAWLLVAACHIGGRTLAQGASTNDQPPVLNALAEPDAEVNTWLARAMDSIRAGDPSGALPFLLRAMQANPAALATTNGVTFLPAQKLAGTLMRALPERTLAAYRMQTGSPPRDLSERSPPPLDLVALEASYRSGLSGDAVTETGFRLAGLYLDRERFADARRVLLNLLEANPAKNVPRSELLARLIVACARVGDTTQAEWAWSEIRKLGDTDRWAFLGAEIRPATTPVTFASNAWTMAYGGSAREGAAAGAGPAFGTNGFLILRWGTNLGPGLVRSEPSPEGQTNLPAYASMSRGYAAKQMTKLNRRPADQPIFAGGKAWVNRYDELVVVDLDTGNVLQRTPHSTNEQSRNWYRSAWGFGNRLNRAASAIGGRVYCVENHDAASPRGYAQTSGNVLAAYVADTGPLLWRVGRELPPAKPEKPSDHWRANAILFLAPPVPCAGLLLAPVEDENGLNVVGLDAEGGRPVWRTRVAYRQLSTAPNLAMLTVDGASAYLCSGRGLVSALDGFDGNVRWTSLYEPSGDFSATNAVSKGANSETLWEENLVLVAGEAVVALPEDSGDILAFDRRSGTPLWRQHKPVGVDYAVGRRGAALIVAGRRNVACVDLTDGRERWRTPIAGSTGRGALCGTEVLIPWGQTILRLRMEDGAPLGSVRAQTMDDLPLGNLYVNGDQLLVAGLERLYALVDARPALARLQGSLARNPTAEAFAERGNLYAGLGYPAAAVADLREAWKRQRGLAGEDSARVSLLMALWRAVEQEPGATEKLYSEVQQIAGTAEERAEATWRLAHSREHAGNTNGALTLYVEMVAAPDVTLSSASGDTNWKTSVRRAAAQRLRTLLANDEPKYRALVEKPALQALAGLGTTPAVTSLVEVATVFAGTTAGRDAAFQAARLAAERGDLGTAEVILQRALVLSFPPARAPVAEELARLYMDRMKWPRGVTQLLEEWPQLGGGLPVPEALARAATNAVAMQRAFATPLPPWRLRWRGERNAAANSIVSPAGLLYSRSGNEASYRQAKEQQRQAECGCLDLETGKVRWHRDGLIYAVPFQPADLRGMSSSHMVSVGFSGNTGDGIMDLWSGAVTTNRMAPSKALYGGSGNPAVTRIGMAVVLRDDVMAGVDALTGRRVWSRGDLDALTGNLMGSSWSALAGAGVVNGVAREDGSVMPTSFDLCSGAILSRRSFVDAREYGLWFQRVSPLRSLADPLTIDILASDHVLENQRLSMRNSRIGAVRWTSPPDLAIVKFQVIYDNDTVLAETESGELVVFRGGDGKILCRSLEDRFSSSPYGWTASAFCSTAFPDVAPSMWTFGAIGAGNAVVASRFQGNGTNEVMVLDPAIGTVTFHGLLPYRNQIQVMPILSLAPAMTNCLMIWVKDQQDRSKAQNFIQIVNSRDTFSIGWRLPRTEDVRDPKRSSFTPFFARGLIIMVNTSSEETLAYEHDPVEEAKKP